MNKHSQNVVQILNSVYFNFLIFCLFTIYSIEYIVNGNYNFLFFLYIFIVVHSAIDLYRYWDKQIDEWGNYLVPSSVSRYDFFKLFLTDLYYARSFSDLKVAFKVLKYVFKGSK